MATLKEVLKKREEKEIEESPIIITEASLLFY
jgi:hypothetical protein